MQRRLILSTLTAAAAVALVTGGPAQAAPQPVVSSVIEGRAQEGNRAVLVLIGVKLNKFKTFELRTGAGDLLGEPQLIMKSSKMIALLLPDGVPSGDHVLHAFFRGAPLTFDVTVTNGDVVAGGVKSEALDVSLRLDLDDATQLGGQDASFYRDADNFDAGTLSPERFSAYDDLVAEDRVATQNGEANKLSPSTHTHDDVYFTKDQLQLPGGAVNTNGRVHWTQLHGVPSEIADGDDANTTYSASSGLQIQGTNISPVYTSGSTAGKATTIARSDHTHGFLGASQDLTVQYAGAGNALEAFSTSSSTLGRGVLAYAAGGQPLRIQKVTNNFQHLISGRYVSTEAFHINWFGQFVQTSDARLKTDVETVEGVLPKLKDVRAVRYRWKHGGDDSPVQLGALAQEVQKAFPELVETSDTGQLSVAYAPLAVVAIQAVKEQQQQIEKQQARLDARDAELAKLRARLDRIEALLADRTDPSPAATPSTE